MKCKYLDIAQNLPLPKSIEKLNKLRPSVYI